MNFGKQVVFDYVRNMIAEPNSEKDYQELYNIIWVDAFGLLSRYNLSIEDKEDIVQDVEISFFPRLTWYVENFRHASPAQRNACLRTIVKRRMNDQLARRYRHSNVTSYDAEDFPEELSGVCEDTFAGLSSRDEVRQALKLICSLNFPAEQIIAYLMTRCTALTSKGGKNGKPAQVARQLAGLTLDESAAIAIRQIQEVCPFAVSMEVYAPLLEKLDKSVSQSRCGDCRFNLTPRMISGVCSQITERLRSIWERLNGGKEL